MSPKLGRGDPAGLVLLAAGGLIVASLAAPWGRPTQGLARSSTPLRGWDWLPTTANAAMLAAVAVTLGLGLARLTARRPRGGLIAIATVSLAAAATCIATGLGSKDVPTEQLGSMVDVAFSVEWQLGPLLAFIGIAVGLIGVLVAATRETSQSPVARRAIGLLLTGAMMGGAMFMNWTWADGEELVDAWQTYEWAATAIVLLAAAIAVSGASRRSLALLALPAAALASPFLDAGVSKASPGGLSEPVAQAGSAMGLGVGLALVAVVAAVALLAPTSRRRERPKPKHSPLEALVGPPRSGNNG